MRRLSMIVLSVMTFAARAAAQENNPCQVALQTVTDPKAIYAASDEWGDPTKITNVKLRVVISGNPEPVMEANLPPTLFVSTGFMGCARAAWTPDDRLLRDGKTVYQVLLAFENSARMVSPWSNPAPFVLSAPVVLPPRAPIVRLGRTED